MSTLVEEPIRLDKWLWAARFFKTRSMAREAIDGGKIHIDGTKAKPSRTVHIGQIISITSPGGQYVVTVAGLSNERRGSTEARLLYKETEESMKAREAIRELYQLSSGMTSEVKPNSKERMLLRRLKGKE